MQKKNYIYNRSVIQSAFFFEKNYHVIGSGNDV